MSTWKELAEMLECRIEEARVEGTVEGLAGRLINEWRATPHSIAELEEILRDLPKAILVDALDEQGVYCIDHVLPIRNSTEAAVAISAIGNEIYDLVSELVGEPNEPNEDVSREI